MRDTQGVYYTFSGQAAHEALHETLNDEDLLRTGEAIANPYFNLANNTRRAFKAKYWPEGLCGYAQEEGRFQFQLKQELYRHEGLHLTGDYRKGASLENCFRAAKSVVKTMTLAPKSSPKPLQNHHRKEKIDYVQN